MGRGLVTSYDTEITMPEMLGDTLWVMEKSLVST